MCIFEIKTMTVKELKQAINDYPDDCPVFLVAEYSDGSDDWLDITDMEELNITTHKLKTLTAIGIKFYG